VTFVFSSEILSNNKQTAIRLGYAADKILGGTIRSVVVLRSAFANARDALIVISSLHSPTIVKKYSLDEIFRL